MDDTKLNIMDDKIAKELLTFIAKTMETESRFLSNQPSTTVEVISLLDEIARLRGLDKNENGKQFNEIADSLRV